MKKVTITLLFAMCFILAFSQTKEERLKAKLTEAKTAIEASELIRMEINFKPINPDTLTITKGVIYMGTKKGKNVFYLKVGKSFYQLDRFYADLTLNGQNYNLRTENDTIKCRGDQNVILFKIE